MTSEPRLVGYFIKFFKILPAVRPTHDVRVIVEVVANICGFTRFVLYKLSLHNIEVEYREYWRKRSEVKRV